MQRFYGYGIVDKDGVPVGGFVDIDIEKSERKASKWNEAGYAGAPFRPVELFYKDGQRETN